MKPIITVFFSLWAFHVPFSAGGPLSNVSSTSSQHDDVIREHQQSSSSSLDFIFLAYDIMDVFSDENAINLEHDDNNRCMFIKTEEGIYSYTSPGGSGPSVVCGLYVVTEPSQVVELQFVEFTVSCSDGGVVSLIDGWELNGQFFPSEVDHILPRDKRYLEFCGSTPPVTSYVTDQNVGLVEFRVPIPGQGFRVRVKFHENLKPCNVLIQVPHGSYTIQNYGRKINCSVSVLFPSTLTLTNMNIGINEALNTAPEESTSIEKSTTANRGVERSCNSRGHDDYVEIRGGDDLDPMFMATYNDYCGEFPAADADLSANSTARQPRVDVGCGNTVMRLVSSGRQHNSVTFQLELFFDTQTSPCPRKKVNRAG